MLSAICRLLWLGPTCVTSDYRNNIFRFFWFFWQALELKQQYTQSARCGSEINFHVITKPEINRTREVSSCITDSSLNPTSAATRTKYMKLCLVHVSHEIGHVMMTPLQSPTPLVLLLACFTKIFQQSGSNANDRLFTIHMHLNQQDFESYKEHKTTKGIGTWNQSWYVACQNRHVLHTNFTSKTYHQNPGIRVLFIRVTHLYVIKVIRPNNADSKSPSWYFRQKKMIISLVQGWGQIHFIKYKYKYKNLDFSNTNTNILLKFDSNTNTNTSIQIQIQIQIRSTKYICRKLFGSKIGQFYKSQDIWSWSVFPPNV